MRIYNVITWCNLFSYIFHLSDLTTYTTEKPMTYNQPMFFTSQSPVYTCGFMFILNRRREKDMLLKSPQQGPWPLYTSAVWVMVEIHLKLSTLLEYSNHVTG